MKELKFTDYFSERLILRNIQKEHPGEILQYSDYKFYDRDTDRLVAVKNIKISARRSRQYMLAYEEYDDYFLAVTIHTITNQQIKSHVRAGRWIEQ